MNKCNLSKFGPFLILMVSVLLATNPVLGQYEFLSGYAQRQEDQIDPFIKEVMTFAKNGQEDSVEWSFQRMINRAEKQGDDSLRFLVSMIRVEMKIKQNKDLDALKDLKFMAGSPLVVNGLNANLYNWISMLHLHQGELDSSLHYDTLMIQANGDDFLYRCNFANHLMLAGHHQAVLELLEAQSDSLGLSGHYILGSSYFELKQYDKALVQVNKYLQTEKGANDWQANLLKAEIELAVERKDEACDVLKNGKANMYSSWKEAEKRRLSQGHYASAYWFEVLKAKRLRYESLLHTSCN